ncbi:D-sedoheptulose-7-phosphate isomerase [Sphaerisporangium fuscum]|uniref:D-sedoheptulose-7-phosphate isomerase n=1 Tax=Sphaerisporangium fuscum TaxID=2835868 RepID=UPI003555C7B8
MQGLGRPGDVAVALTTSGRSTNIVPGLERARRLGLTTVALTGQAGGPAAGIADLCVRVPADDTPPIQEACIHLGHTICELVEAKLFPVRQAPLTTVFPSSEAARSTPRPRRRVHHLARRAFNTSSAVSRRDMT